MTEIVTPRLPSLPYVDALLGTGPHWNFLPAHDNTIRYTFALSSANGDHVADALAFTPTQQANTRAAFEYIGALTGIRFVETADAAAAQVHLACADILEAEVAGVCISTYSYTEGAATNDYRATSYVYIDNQEWYDYAGELVPGTDGYELLLHELGHMLGLKHPFETETDNPVTLPSWQDHTGNTLMSYTSQGEPHSAYGQFDIAALMWLYGGDGLGGRFGVGGAGGYWMGSSDNNSLSGAAADDVLQGAGGDDVIDGGGGSDIAVYSGTRASYDITWSIYSREATVTASSGQEGSDRVRAVELFQFADGLFTLAEVTGADLTPPAPPVLAITEENGRVSIGGSAEPNSFVEVFYSRPGLAATSLGLYGADASGAWALPPMLMSNDSYIFYATASDASANRSSASAEYALVVDAVLPAAPTLLIEQDARFLVGGNRPVMYGTAHPGSMVQVFVDMMATVTTTADADGNWEAVSAPLFPGTRSAYVVATTPDGRTIYDGALSTIRIDATAGFGGSDASDSFVARAGNNVYSGGAGADTIAYAGARSAFSVTVGERGVTVTDTLGDGGTDTLFSVERLQFGDQHIAVDIGGNGGQAYRLYNAVLDRAPDEAGLGFWMSNMDKGVSLSAVAGDMMTSPEFIANFGANLSNQQLVETLYQNILDRAPEQAGMAYWLDALDKGTISQPDALAFISESVENRSSVDPTIANGFMYSPWA